MADYQVHPRPDRPVWGLRGRITGPASDHLLAGVRRPGGWHPAAMSEGDRARRPSCRTSGEDQTLMRVIAYEESVHAYARH